MAADKGGSKNLGEEFLRWGFGTESRTNVLMIVETGKGGWMGCDRSTNSQADNIELSKRKKQIMVSCFPVAFKFSMIAKELLIGSCLLNSA
ncbi:MAG: hypothetical protein RLZZ507_3581 [Cyanobacteriota bacterium]